LLRRRLPEHAQDIYRSAFNNAWERYGDSNSEHREEIAHRVAWSAVKKRYRKAAGVWILRADYGLSV